MIWTSSKRPVWNNAFTEAFAFTFQERDLELLGLGSPDAVAVGDDGAAVAEPPHLVPHARAGLRVEPGGGFVQEQELWPVHHAERDVEREGTGRDDRDAGTHRVLPELHHGALAVLLLDLRERDVEHLVPVHRSLLSSPPGTRPAGRDRARTEDAIPCL